MSLREWLILLGALIVIGIVIDGVRRMHRARKDSLEISRGMGADQLEDSPLDGHNPELPGGGARVVEGQGVSVRERPARPVGRRAAGRHHADEPAEEGLSAGGPDDDLAEDFSLRAEAREDGDLAWPRDLEVPDDDEDKYREEADSSASSDQDEIPTLKEPTPVGRPVVSKPERPVEPTKKLRRPFSGRKAPAAQPAPTAQPAPAAAAPQKPKRPLAGANRPPAKEVFVINVDSRNPEGFRGADLKRLFEACGLELGDMNIYHRHENDDTETPVQFSVANAVEPGTFPAEGMEAMSTPAISFFMSLPGPTDSLQAYDFMIETAQCVVRNLGGDLKDERRSVVTTQTIEHGRQRVREFERKRRSVKA